MTEETFGSRLRAALRAKHWNQSDLVRESGLDKNTVSALVNDRQRANPGTLGRIEAALGMTLDTLSGVGEEPQLDLGSVPEEALLTELTARVRNLKARVAELERGRRPEDQKNPGDDGASVTPIRPGDGGSDAAHQPIAARRGRSQGKQLRAELDKLGEDNQDTGGEDPA